MNKWIGTGRLTADPDVRTTADGMTVSSFTIATDRRFKKDETDFFKCTAFKSTGDFVARYLKKGTKVIISGSIQNDNYTKKDGTKVYGVQIIVDEIEFAESKKKEETSDNGFVDVPDDVVDSLPFK